MVNQIEAERKFLVEAPKSWLDMAKLFDGIVDVKRITQCYLIPEKGEPAARVRKTIEGLSGDKEIVYHYNQKTPIKPGVHNEKEHEISKAEYEKHLKRANPSKFPIEKTRFVFKHNDQVFELDLFKGRLKGLAILEIELENIEDKVILPAFLLIIKEVTNDKSYNNFNLASKTL
jgi:CYTH domain-containing protein